MNDHRETASVCPLFVGLDQDELAEVVARLEPRSYEQGESIYAEGDSRRCMTIIVSGECEVVKRVENGSRRLAVLADGSVFGELSFFDPAPHSATVRALTPMETLGFSRDAYEQLLRTHPSVAHKIAVNTVVLVSDRLRRMDEWVYELLDQSGARAQKEEWQEFRTKLYTDWQF